MVYRKSHGGRLWHLLATIEETKALCGYDPTSPSLRTIAAQGRWAALRTEPPMESPCILCMITNDRKMRQGKGQGGDGGDASPLVMHNNNAQRSTTMPRDAMRYYCVYGGYYGHAGEGDHALAWEPDSWCYTLWKYCGDDLQSALAVLAEAQQTVPHFCGISVSFRT